PAGDDWAVLDVGMQLGEDRRAFGVEKRRQARKLCSDVGLVCVGTDIGDVAARAEEKADRLGEDRLPRAGLARDGVQPRREGVLRPADEDEVLDPKAPEHGLDATPSAPVGRSAQTAGSALALASL